MASVAGSSDSYYILSPVIKGYAEIKLTSARSTAVCRAGEKLLYGRSMEEHRLVLRTTTETARDYLLSASRAHYASKTESGGDQYWATEVFNLKTWALGVQGT